MKKSKTISLSKLALFLFLNCVFNNPYLFILIIIYLLFFNYKETLVYFILCVSIFVSYYIQKNSLQILTNVISGFKGIFYARLGLFKEETISSLKLLLFNENDYSDLYNLSYGITSYYIIQIVYSKNRIVGLVLCAFMTFFFGFEQKYLIILVDYLLDISIKQRESLKQLSIICLLIVYPAVKENISIYIIILIKLYSLYEIELEFKLFISVMVSRLFGSVNPIQIFFFRSLLLIRIIMYLTACLTLFFPSFESIFMYLIKLYSAINNFTDIKIKGCLNIVCIILLMLIISILNIKNQLIQIIIIYSLMFCGLNTAYTKVSFIDVGQGDAILIRSSFNKNTILIDTGSSYNWHKLQKYLDSQSVYKIDSLVITHDDEDHNGNKDRLKENYKVTEVIEKGKDILLDNLILYYLDLGTYDNDNDNSLVYFFEKNGLSFLLTGDISKEAEMVYVEKYGYHTDVLKVSHHGSKTGSSKLFIETVLPRISVISTNGKYNHPDPETLEMLNNYLSRVITTKDESTVEFIFVYRYCIVHTCSNWFVII